jgi:hypothetical protein
MRYIPVGGEAQFDRFAIPIKYVTAEKEAIPNAARKYTAAVSANHRGFANKLLR